MVHTTKEALNETEIEVRYIHNNGIPKIINQGDIPEELKFIAGVAQPGDILILTFFRGKLYTHQHHIPLHKDPYSEQGVDSKLNNFVKVIQDYLKLTEESGLRIVLVDDVPQMKMPTRVSPCIIQKKLGLSNSCDLPTEQSLHTRKPMTETFQSLSELPRVEYWDPHPYICPDELCTFDNEKFIKMTDHNHISLDQATSLATPLREFFRYIQLLK